MELEILRKFQLVSLTCSVLKRKFFLILGTSEIRTFYLCERDRWPTGNGLDRLYSHTLQVKHARTMLSLNFYVKTCFIWDDFACLFGDI